MRVYDTPRTPYQRVIDSGVLSPATHAEFEALFAGINPAELTRGIAAVQTQLIHLATAKTTAHTANVSRAKPREARGPVSRAS